MSIFLYFYFFLFFYNNFFNLLRNLISTDTNRYHKETTACKKLLLTDTTSKERNLVMFGKKKEKNNFEGITIYTAFHHVNGLPIPENVLCEVFSYPDRIDFKSGTTEIKLPKEKITDISIKTDTEIQQQLVSSAGGAIAGAMLFGSLGAIIGGRIKTKKVKTTTNYLIITYKSENELKYIGFDIQNNPPSADKLVKEFQKSNSASGVKIEL